MGKKKAARQSKQQKQKPDSSSGSQAKLDPEIVKKYYPAFENLALLLLGPRRWWRALKAFLRDEFDYRAALLVRVLILMLAGVLLVAASVILLIKGFYELALQWLGNPALAALLLFAAFLVIGVLLLIIMLKNVERLFEARKDPVSARAKSAAKKPRIFDEPNDLEQHRKRRRRSRRAKAKRTEME